MAVDTKSVQGRRNLQFNSLDQIVQDAEALVASPKTQVLGNWPLAKLLTHLSSTIDQSIDGFATKAPLIVRLIGPFLKRSTLKEMGPGIKLPKSAEAVAFPDAGSLQEALAGLKQAVARTKKERMTAIHPAFGKMTHEEWTTLHLRHSEMHLSFAVPG